MQRIVIEEPYQFIPPHRGRFWPSVFQLFLPSYLRRAHGIVAVECRGTASIRRSISSGHGIVLAPNHCRPCDPFVLGMLSREIGVHLHTMASWHVFKQKRLTAFMIRRMGAFSVYREGVDRKALNCAVEILVTGARPLVLFPEGVITRTNDRLAEFMDGTSFVARTASRKRRKSGKAGDVVVHPVALKYVFRGEINAALSPTLDAIETRLAWRPGTGVPLFERVRRIGNALLCLKEIELIGSPQSGSFYKRVEHLIDCLLTPIEDEWLQRRRNAGTSSPPSHETSLPSGKTNDRSGNTSSHSDNTDRHSGKTSRHSGGREAGDVVARVKKLRAAILPELVDGRLTLDERSRRWRQLADLYLAQQLRFYPRGYVTAESPQERLLETVERFEEDLTDQASVHGPLKVVVEVGDAIVVESDRARENGTDPLTHSLHERLGGMLDTLAREFSPPRSNGRPEAATTCTRTRGANIS